MSIGTASPASIERLAPADDRRAEPTRTVRDWWAAPVDPRPLLDDPPPWEWAVEDLVPHGIL